MEALGQAISFLFALAIAGLIGVFLLGGYLTFDWFKGDIIESPKRLTPEIKLIINDNKVDTLYIYKIK